MVRCKIVPSDMAFGVSHNFNHVRLFDDLLLGSFRHLRHVTIAVLRHHLGMIAFSFL